MRGAPLQPAGHFRELSPVHRKMRVETANDLAAMIRDLRGDPRLTAWEEGFLTNVENLLRQSHGHIELTQKQWNRAWIIHDRLAGASEREEEDEPVDSGPSADADQSV